MERQDMVNVLNSIFTKGILINLNDETFEILKEDGTWNERCTHFSDWINIFIDEGNIHPSYIETVKNTLNIEHMKLVKTPRYINYRRFAGVVDGVKTYIRVTAILIPSVLSTEENPVMLLGIIPTDGFLDIV